VLAPPPENDDVVNDFDIEEEVTEVENRSVKNPAIYSTFKSLGSVRYYMYKINQLFYSVSMH